MDEELKKIVANMVAAGESEENIAIVIQNYDSVKKKEQSIPASTPTSIVSKEVPKPLQESGTTTNSQVDAVDNYIKNADGKLPTDGGFMANVGTTLSNEKISKPRQDLIEVTQEQKDLEEAEKLKRIDKDKKRVYTALDYLSSDKEASKKKLYSMDDDELQSVKDDLIDRLKLSPDAIDEAIAERKQQFKKERDVLIVNDAKKKTKEDLINKAINKSVDLEKYEPQIFRRDAKPDITQPLGFTPKKTTILSKLNEEDKKKVIQEAEKEYNANIDIKAYSLLSEDDKNLAKNNAEFQSVSEQLKDALSNKDGIDEKKSIELKEKLVELEMQRKELGARERLYNPFTGQTIDRDKATPEIVEFNNTVQQMKKSLTDKDITKKVLEDNLIKLEYFQNKLDEKIPNYQNITYRDLLNPATTMKYQFIDEATEKEAFKLRDEFLDAGAKAQALSSAIYTNQDPAAIKRGLFKESGGSDAFGRGLSDAIGLRNRLTDLDEAEIATKFTEAMQEAEENNVLTKAQIENAKETFGEKLTYGAGASLPVMADIIANTMLLESGAGALGVARGLVKMRGLIETIVKSKKASNLFTNIIKEGAKGVITFAPTSETGLTGSVEGVTQALLPQNMFKGNKYGKLLELGTRTLAGTATETPAELAGMYVQSASDNGWDMEAAFDRTFGRTPKEIWETLAMTTATSAMMSGTFNSLRILLSSKKGLEQEVAKGNVPKEDLEAVQEIITLADEKLRSDNPKVVTIKSEGKESIVPTEDFEATLQDEAFIEKVANGDIDVSIDNDTELGNRLNEKVEEFKTKQEYFKELEDDSENEAGLPSNEQVETPKVEAGSVGVGGDVEVGAKPKPIDEQSIAASQKWIKDLYSLPDLTRIQDKNGNVYDIKDSKIRKLTLDKEGNVIDAEIIHTDRDVHKRGAYSNPDFFNEGYRVLPEQSLKETPKAETTKTNIDETESTGTTETTEDDTKSNTRLDDAPTGKEESIPEIERKEEQTGIRTSRLPITDIEVRPEVFQFKAVDEESGVNKAEKLEGSYDENLAGTIGVWVDTKGEVGDVGKTYVVDGHHRMEFAKRNNIDEMNVFYIDAPTANDAKVIAAKANIAQGRGTAIDAAKVFKSSPESETKSFIPKSKVGRDGLALSNLSEPLFNLVVNGKLSVDRGVLLSQGKDATVQESVYNEIKKIEGSGTIKMKNSTIKEYIDAGNSSNKTTETTVDLFGETEQEKVDISTRMNLLGTIRDKLISAKNIFGQAARNSDVLNKVGNKVNEEMNAGLSKDAAENIALFDAFKNTTILSKTINNAVDKYKEAKTRKEKTDITEKLYNDIIGIVTKEVGKESTTESKTAAEETKRERIEREIKQASINFRKGGLSSGGLQSIAELVKLISKYVELGILNVQDLIDRIRKDFPNEPLNTKMVDDALAIINAEKNIKQAIKNKKPKLDALNDAFNDYQANGGTLSLTDFIKGLTSHTREQKKIKEQAKVEERKAETETILESKPKTKEDKIKKVALKLGLKTQQDLNKEVADLIKEHMVKGLLNDRQVKALTKRALGVKVGNLKSQTDFANFFNKVMDDVEYVNKHTEAQSIISKAKKQAKSKTAFENTENLANKIASIDINYIENIDGLLDVLREYNDDKKVPNVAKLTNDINPFVEESMLGKEEALRQKTFEIAEGLGYGKAALNGLTYAEIKKLLETPTGLEETLSSEEKLQEKKAAMVEANSILRDFLKGLDTTELSAKEKGLLKDLINVDLSELNLGELKSLFLVGNNILTNQSFANAENLAITFKSKHDAKVFLKQVKNSKIMLSKAWLNPFRSFQQLIDNIFMKNRVLAAKFTDLIGELNANEGRKIVKDKTDIFIERFNKILNDNKLNTLADRARITAAALGLRYDGYHNMTEEEEFQGNKADINANYENTKNDADFKDELQEAKEAADFINQFKTKKDLEDFLNKKENKGMKDALTFIEKSFAKIAQERVDLSSTMFNSGMKLVDKHYTPKKVITRDKNDADSVNPFEQKYTQISLTPKRAGSAIDANKPGSLGNNRLGLDLLVYGSYEMEKALTEIHLSKATLKAKTILKSKDVQDVLGISTTRLLEEKIKNQYAPQIERSQSSAKLNSVIDFIRKSTTASILSGFSQLIKQSSVIANISSTLPTKQALLFSKELATGLKNFKVATLITPTITKQLVNPIHKMFAIGSRVEMNIGVDRGETARKARKNLLGKQSGFIRMTGKYLGKGHDVITDLLLSPMHVQDIYISTATWNAAYKGYLAENGITDVDMATEHEKIVGDNNEAQIRREAAAYAEHMVGITQIPSDAAQRAEIMKDGNMSSKLLRIITTPFNNFGINSLVRKVDAVKGLFNKEGKVQSAKDLVGLVAEAAAFQYTKYALAIHVFPKLASITYAALTGEDEDDVDELVKVDKEYAEKVIDRSLDALYVDLVLQGTPEAAKELTVSLLNAINYNFKKENGLIDDSISFSDWQKEGGGLSQFKKDDDYLIQSYGLLGIMPTKLSNSYTSTKLRREGIVEGFMGKDKKVKLADKDKRVMQVIEVIEYLNAMGLSGADLSNISSKIKKGILDKHKGKKGAKKKVIKPIS